METDSALFIHPTNLDSRCWLPVALLLQGRPCILLDSRGHGSSHYHGPFRVEDYAADVCAVIHFLRLRRVHLVGASLGGSIGCAVASARPDVVASLSVIGGSLRPAAAAVVQQLSKDFESMSVPQMMESFIAQELERGLPATQAEQLRIQTAANNRDLAMVRDITLQAFCEDAHRFAAGVKCRVQVLTGEWDTSCPPDDGAAMAMSVGGTFELLRGVGHLPMLQSPAMIAERLRLFMDGSKCNEPTS